MKIIKRNGAEVGFDITKIIIAITKANEDVDEAVFKYSHGALEHVTLYSLFQDPMTSCGCFECICGVEPVTMGVVITCREHAGMTPLGMTFSEMASMTGGGAEAQALAEKMSSAWLNFARTGNPNAEGLPEWEPYTAEKGATMIFNNDCQVKYNHDKELLEVVMAFPTRGF